MKLARARAVLLGALLPVLAHAAAPDGPAPPPSAALAPALVPARVIVGVRAADHGGYSRIVLDFPAKVTVTRSQDGAVVTLRVPDGLTFGVLPRGLRNVVALRADGQALDVQTAPGTTVQGSAMAGKYVLDVGDGPPGTVPLAAPVVAPARPAVEAAASAVPPAKQMAAPVAIVSAAQAAAAEAKQAAPARAERATPVSAASAEPVSTAQATPIPATKAQVPATQAQAHGKSGQAAPGLAALMPTSQSVLLVPPERRPGTRTVHMAEVAAKSPALPLVVTPGATAVLVPGALPVVAGPAPGSPGPSTPAASVAGLAAMRAEPVGPVLRAPLDDAEAPAAAAAADDPDYVPPAVTTPDGTTRLHPVPPAAGATAAFAVPAGRAVGAAAFRRGAEAIVVLDGRRTLDVSALTAVPAMNGVRAEALADATVLHVPLAADGAVRLGRGTWRTRRGRGGDDSWIISTGPALAPARAMAPLSDEGRITLPTAGASQVVMVPDPVGGGLLLVGTERADPKRSGGSAVPATRQAPGFSLLSTFQGAAVDALADDLALQVTPTGFVLSGANTPVTLADTTADAVAQALTRSFDFPDLPTADLLRRLRTGIGDAAQAGPLSRAPMRMGVARAMMALGFGAEAQATVQLAGLDDPRVRERPETIALAASAALLAGRTQEAAGLDDSRLPVSDELQFWRAARDVLRAPDAAMTRLRAAPDEATLAGPAAPGGQAELDPDQPPAAAVAAMVATSPILALYPRPLQARLGPIAVETLAAGGEGARAAALLAALRRAGVGDETLLLARAMTAEAQDQPDAALALYDTVIRGRDQLARVRAVRRATDLRLKLGRLTPDAAATVLEQSSLAWRDDAHDLALRLRAAELRRAVDGAASLRVLRDAWQAFPQANLRSRMQAVLSETVTGPEADRLAPLDLVSLVDGNADLLPGDGLDTALTDRMARKLVALDLPSRALPLLERLTQSAPAPVARARFAMRAADMLLAERDPTRALSMLRGIADPPAEPRADPAASVDEAVALSQQRRMLTARALAMTGDTDGALAQLADVPGREADLQRAGLLEARQNFAAAAAALRDALTPVLAAPDTAPLDGDTRALTLRLASALARAGDEAGLASLRAAVGERVPPGPDADMLHLLTAPPVRTIADMSRAAKDTASARAFVAAAGK